MIPLNIKKMYRVRQNVNTEKIMTDKDEIYTCKTYQNEMKKRKDLPRERKIYHKK